MVRVAWGSARRIAVLAAVGAALVTGTVVGVSAHTGAGAKPSHLIADPCPCTLPQCISVCRQN